MAVPNVAIVGRPNVGKSSLLNWLARRLVSVVDPTAGVTRDRVSYLMQEGDRYFELIDTGGIGIIDSDQLSDQIEQQIQIGIERADLILFVVDAQAGPVPLDQEVAHRLRRVRTPKVLVVNKCDNPKLEADAPQFIGLAPDAPLVMTSVKGNRNRDELLRTLVEQLPPAAEQERIEGERQAGEPELKLAIVGRRNVGKSTFINALAEEERVIVSEVPGTTRDSIDVRFERDGKTLVAIDTPGVRKKKSLANDIEFYGLVRAQRSIRRADVVLMFFDSQETVSRVDKQLVQDIHDSHKPCVFVVTKWDKALEAKMTSEGWAEYLTREFPSMTHVPVAFITGKESKNIQPVVNLAQSLFKQARLRVPTADLNRVVRAAVRHTAPPVRKNRRPKVFYATQVGTEPPTIVLKCNDPSLFEEPWKRYLLNVLRDNFPFAEVPIKLYLRARQRDDEGRKGMDELPQDVEVEDE